MEIVPNGNKKVLWKCNNGHKWEARVADGNNGQGYPECYKIKRKKK